MEPTEICFFLNLSTQHNILISIHVAGCIRGLFLFIVSSIHCMNLTVCLSIPLLVDIWLILVIMNKFDWTL